MSPLERRRRFGIVQRPRSAPPLRDEADRWAPDRDDALRESKGKCAALHALARDWDLPFSAVQARFLRVRGKR
ncbi:MAG: hypothetical protein CML02_02410 [Pseudooceanicola sp.]|nr:hypothetical protein [Pseudooceanicola sp.]